MNQPPRRNGPHSRIHRTYVPNKYDGLPMSQDDGEYVARVMLVTKNRGFPVGGRT